VIWECIAQMEVIFQFFRFFHHIGHGDLSCSACHGSTHAIYPSNRAEDNLQNERIQGYSGTLSNCASCHEENIYTANGGPHGMHQIGSSWVRNHENVAERSGTSSCTACHGSDYRGSALSEMFETRTLDGKIFEKGEQIGCYDCHNGPSGH
jgi:mono/diheme cytochrome c family protein